MSFSSTQRNWSPTHTVTHRCKLNIFRKTTKARRHLFQQMWLQIDHLLSASKQQGSWYERKIDHAWFDVWKKAIFAFSNLLGGQKPTQLKNMIVKMGSSSPRFGVQIKKLWVAATWEWSMQNWKKIEDATNFPDSQMGQKSILPTKLRSCLRVSHQPHWETGTSTIGILGVFFRHRMQQLPVVTGTIEVFYVRLRAPKAWLHQVVPVIKGETHTQNLHVLNLFLPKKGTCGSRGRMQSLKMGMRFIL